LLLRQDPLLPWHTSPVSNGNHNPPYDLTLFTAGPYASQAYGE
jgi:hypothetical protein